MADNAKYELVERNIFPDLIAELVSITGQHLARPVVDICTHAVL